MPGKKLKGPKVLIFVLTYRCNARCVMCSVWQKQEAGGDFPVPELKKLLADPIFTRNLEVISLTGGEPFLRKDVLEIIKLFLESCPRLKRIDIPTNGLETETISEQVETIIAAAIPFGVKICVSVSLDGTGKVHDRIRGTAGAFQKTVATIDELRDFQEIYRGSFSLGVNATFSSYNYDNLESLLDYAENHNFGIFFTPVAISEIYVESARNREKIELDPQHRKIVSVFFRKLLKKRKVERFYARFVRDAMEGKRRRSPCAYQQGISVLLDVTGELFSCGNFQEGKIGNVLQESFSQIWTRDQAEKVRRQLLATKCPECWSNCYIQETHLFQRIISDPTRVIRKIKNFIHP